MSIILFILFIYILYLLLRPAFKVWRTYRKMKTGSFDIFGDFSASPEGSVTPRNMKPTAPGKGDGQSPAPRKRKYRKMWANM